MPKKDLKVIDETVDTSNDDDDLLKDKKIDGLINKKELTEKDFEIISKLIYGKRILIFRQRSLRTIAARVEKEMPNKFTKKELNEIKHVYETRSKDKAQETIDLIRHKEAVLKSNPKSLIQTGTRTRTKTKHKDMEGYSSD
jgi:hypothetical protein